MAIGEEGAIPGQPASEHGTYKTGQTENSPSSEVGTPN